MFVFKKKIYICIWTIVCNKEFIIIIIIGPLILNEWPEITV